MRQLLWLTMAALAGLTGTGCGMGRNLPMEPIDISYDVPGGAVTLLEVEKPHDKLLRIAQFEDKRPPKEVKGAAPRTWRFLVINWRRGNFVTSNKVWKTPQGTSTLAEAVTTTAKDCLAKTTFFEEIKVEGSASPKGGSGYILEAEIENFYAQQHLSRYFFFLMYQQEGENIGVPKGFCKITYRLLDAESDQVIHKNTVESTASDSKAKIGEVGLKALREAQTKMANDLTRVLLEL